MTHQGVTKALDSLIVMLNGTPQALRKG